MPRVLATALISLLVGSAPSAAQGVLGSYFPDAVVRVESAAVSSARSSSLLAFSHALDNPAVLVVLRSLGLSPEDVAGGGRFGPRGALANLVELSTGEFEFVLPEAEAAGASRRAGVLPPFVCRFRLAGDRADQVAKDLRSGRLTRPRRRISGFQTHAMRSGRAAFEVVLVGDDLLVGSGPSGDVEHDADSPLALVLRRQPGASSDAAEAGAADVRGSTPRTANRPSLRPDSSSSSGAEARMPTRPSGSLTLLLDWKHLAHALQAECHHASRWLDRWIDTSSLGGVVVQLTASRARGGGTPGTSSTHRVVTEVELHRAGDRAGSLLRATRKEPIRRLAAKLSPTGLGALVVATRGGSLGGPGSAASAPSPETAIRRDLDRGAVEIDADPLAGGANAEIAEVETVIKTSTVSIRSFQDRSIARLTIDERDGETPSRSAERALSQAFDRVAAKRFEKRSADAVFRISPDPASYGAEHVGAIDIDDECVTVRMTNVINDGR